MKPSSNEQRLFSSLALLVIMLIICPVYQYGALAQSKIEYSAAVGFSESDYIARLNHWTPVYILMQNQEKNLEGYFEITSDFDDRTYRIPFTSPRDSTMLFPAFIFLQEGGLKNEYTLRLIARGADVQPSYIALTPLKEEDFYFVAL